MVLPGGHSGLVRLSDCLKIGVSNALATTKELTTIHQKHADVLKEIRDAARKCRENKSRSETPEEIQSVAARIPIEDAQTAVSLQGQLHSETLSVILTSCFALESYINSLAFFLMRERDLIGLVRNSTASAAGAFMDAFDKMSTTDKWKCIGNLKSESGFNIGEIPFQHIKILFRFRDDHVHDKVVDWNSERAQKRYNGKFPDPFGGVLALSHAVFACDVYWEMICKIHDLVGVPVTGLIFLGQVEG